MLMRLSCLLLLVGLALAGLAQGDPNQPTRPAPQPPAGLGNLTPENTAVITNPLGVYLIHYGVVARYPADMGQPVLRELFGVLPAQPTVSDKPTDAERAAMSDWLTQLRLRQAPQAVVYGEKMLHIIVGTRYFRVNAETLEVPASGDLAPATRPVGSVTSRQAPQLCLLGDTLLVIVGQELVLVNTVDGKVITRMPPPAAMFPKVDFAALHKAFGQSTGPQPAPPGGPK